MRAPVTAGCRLTPAGAKTPKTRVMTSEEAAAAHKETNHYKVWRDTVADWMAKPRQGIKYKGIRP